MRWGVSSRGSKRERLEKGVVMGKDSGMVVRLRENGVIYSENV